MADATSALKVEVDDAEFTRFAKAFKQHNYELTKNSSEWGKLQAALRKSNNIMGQFVLAQHMWSQLQAKNATATATQVNNIKNAAGGAANQSQRMAMNWGAIAKNTGTAASNALKFAASIFRLSYLGTAGLGLLGVGGFFGLRRLGRDVTEGRRLSLGQGLTYGQRQAFNLNFASLLGSPEGFLGGVNASLTDITKRGALNAIGVTDTTGGTGAVSLRALQNIKNIVDRTPDQLLGQLLSARRIGELGLTAEDLRAIKSTPRGEFAGLVRDSQIDQRTLDLQQDTQRRWRDFYTQLNRSGTQLENVLVRGLEKLTPSLEALSKEFINFLQGLTESPHFKEWIDSFGKGIEDLATYIGSKSFRDNVITFAEDIGILAHAVHNFLVSSGIETKVVNPKDVNTVPQTWAQRWGLVPSFPGGMTYTVPFRGLISKPSFRGLIHQGGLQGLNNPGMLRVPGSTTQFQSFFSTEAGLRAMANQLLLYQDRDKLNTISGILNKYAPSSENDTESYIRDVAGRTKFDRDQPLNLHDPMTMSKLISAMTGHEGVRPVSKEVVIKIFNAPGNNANVSINNVGPR